MNSKAYRATQVKDVNWEEMSRGKEGLDITLGVDVGKDRLWPVCRWAELVGRSENATRLDATAWRQAMAVLCIVARGRRWEP